MRGKNVLVVTKQCLLSFFRLFCRASFSETKTASNHLLGIPGTSTLKDVPAYFKADVAWKTKGGKNCPL
jgi:hypothetical protein